MIFLGVCKMDFDEEEHRKADAIADNYEEGYEDTDEYNDFEEDDNERLPIRTHERTRDQVRQIKRQEPNEHEYRDGQEEIHHERMNKFRSFFQVSHPEIQKVKSRRVGLSLYWIKEKTSIPDKSRKSLFDFFGERRNSGGGDSSINPPQIFSNFFGGGLKRPPKGGFFFNRI
jgi:hypothetical protein